MSSDRTSDSQDLVRQIEHMGKPRMVRFWRTAGALGAVQCVIVAGVLTVLAAFLARKGAYLELGAAVVFPAAAGFFLRGVLVEHFDKVRRILNLVAWGFVIFALARSSVPALNSPEVVTVVLALMSFYISAYFWLLSDRWIVPAG